MPANLRFVIMLFALAALAAPFSVYFIERQDQQTARTQAKTMTGGHVAAGEIAVDRVGCSACHRFSSVCGTAGKVGPSLTDVAVRAEIAGRLANTPDDMLLWLRHPQQIALGSGMPDQDLGERDARDIAAYLYTLRR
ncbi:c-type cytochrome [Sphingomonas nostoxanthinifaciens]|uniref:c-type cytochrome n=1 Tax=Sphingomonas nostoxanthinifaciens TaxID=2872652 RepID=UPI001CC20A9A|nr:c-type cytochrome [Sphingomonas nostoxanthinifaciens]UAK25568.1 c-type cytochrome [Sphingomonas nostoxanthinifaciens]